VGGSVSAGFASEIPLLSSFLYLLDEAECDPSRGHPTGSNYGAPLAFPLYDLIRGHCQAGSLTGAVHLSNTNAGVLRLAPAGQKPALE
jgi:hypothetical protein